MATNINPNYNPETEQTNQLYNTQIPALSEDANIQEALRLYHYGVGAGLPTTNAQIQPNSVAGHLRSLRSDVSTLQSKGTGSEYSATRPSNVDDGYLWVNSLSAATVFESGIPTIAFYQPSEPSLGLVTGMLWIDSDDNSLYVYSADSWNQISAGGGTSAGNSNELSLTGLGVDVTASSTGQFMFDPGTGPQFFAASLNVSPSYSKTEISLSAGAAASSGVGQIILQRVINADPLSTTTVAAFSYSSGNLQFSYIDSHGQTSGTNVSYILTNATTDSVTFSSANSSAIQISAREVE
jgi:hypothetical protein